MKAAFLAVLLVSIASCRFQPVHEQQIVVTTPTGRKVAVTQRYTIKQIEVGTLHPERITGPKELGPFEIKHPVYPTKESFASLKEHFLAGDELWYFQGLDSGWVVVRNRSVAYVLVTSHES